MTDQNSFLVKSEEAAPNAPRELWGQLQRVMKLVTLGKVLMDSITTAELREQAAFLMSPAIKPLLMYVSAEFRERTEAEAAKVLAMKVHPWIAESERLRTPTKRYTEWGNASTTMGLAKGDNGMWTRVLHFATARDGIAGPFVDIRGFITADAEEGGFVALFLRETRELFMLREMLPTGMVAQAEALLGLTQPGPAPMVHLHGQTWKALVQTGTMSSEAISDVATLLLRPRFPLANSEGWSDQASGLSILSYSARAWVEGSNSQSALKPFLTRPLVSVPLYVQPQHPEHIDGFGLRQLTPEMIKPVIDSEYFGDEDANFRPLTIEGIAAMLGTSVQNMLSNGSIMTRLGHLIVNVAGKWVPSAAAGNATRIFNSSRTRQPWRVAVHVPTNAMPTETCAMDERTSPSRHDIDAYVFMTPEMPTLAAATLALADAAAIQASKGIGAE
jgi:hypothetical protein